MSDIVLKNTNESRKAWRIAALEYSANVAERGEFIDAAKYLRIKSDALKYGIPDGCQSFEDDYTVVEIT